MRLGKDGTQNRTGELDCGKGDMIEGWVDLVEENGSTVSTKVP